MKKLEKSNSLKKINKCIGLTIVMLMVSLVFISCDILLTETDDDDNGNVNDDYEPDNTFEEAREITSFPTGNLTGTVLTTAANDNGGDYEFFKVTLKGDKKVLWSVDPEASNTELHFNVYKADKTYLGKTDGADGETIGNSVNNVGSTDTHFYIKLGAFVGDNGDYTISFTETDAD